VPQRYQFNLTGLCRGETGAGGILRIEDSAGHVKQKVLEEGFFDFLNKVCFSFLLRQLEPHFLIKVYALQACSLELILTKMIG
jgi:hypothetical protein